jgi:hypothetical protein
VCEVMLDLFHDSARKSRSKALRVLAGTPLAVSAVSPGILRFPVPRTSVPPMRSLFAALLLLFQLQPVLGAAACLGLVQQPAQTECEMPEHGTVPAQHYSESVPVPAQSCAIASFCAPAPLAIPGFSSLLETTVVLHAIPSITRSSQPLHGYSAPPFHPPRA